MFLNASRIIFETAKRLREKQTEAEKILWEYLRKWPLGYKFRRQHALSKYIADFYCHALKLVIEVDGEIHEIEVIKNQDEERHRFLEDNGLRFLRFTNDEVKTNLGNVIRAYRRLHQSAKYKVERRIRNTITKHLPLGSGLYSLEKQDFYK